MLASLPANFPAFYAMLRSIAKQMPKGHTDLIHDGAIQIGISSAHIKLYLFIQLSGQIPHHPRKLVDNAFNRNHSYLHDRLMQICGNIFQILNSIMQNLILSAFPFRHMNGHQSVFNNNQFTDLIHKRV